MEAAGATCSCSLLLRLRLLLLLLLSIRAAAAAAAAFRCLWNGLHGQPIDSMYQLDHASHAGSFALQLSARSFLRAFKTRSTSPTPIIPLSYPSILFPDTKGIGLRASMLAKGNTVSQTVRQLVFLGAAV